MYSRIPISRISKGNKNWFEKSGVQNIGGQITVKQIQGNDFWFELSGCLRNRGIAMYGGGGGGD